MIDTDFVPRQIERDGGPDLDEVVDLLMELHRRLDRIEGLLRVQYRSAAVRLEGQHRFPSNNDAEPYGIDGC